MLSIKNTTNGYLKDVEIKGNTIQDAEDLADIRSVGTKVEGQELYEIPVLSRGKNLCNPNDFVLGKIIHENNGDLTENVNIFTSGYIPIKKGVRYIRGATTTNYHTHIYDKNKKWLKRIGATDFIAEIDGYYRFSLNKSYLDSGIMMNVGDKLETYEPYQGEHKLTILSPTQLEKVGDVADRIICKDGVWGVEKNVENYIVPTNLGWNEYKTSIKEGCFGCYANGLDLSDFSDLVKDKENYAISEKFTVNSGYLVASSTTNGMYIRTDLNAIYLKGESSSFKALGVSLEGSLIKYPTNTPQFIPLPHDQQVKLRTFAGQTNIHFETEIEGTIKAQVPKSIGASINTHTEQIANLNNELNRVKKLEESTVSTVETESDFTTVTETSNGYFEDVKLEGKTLVNLFNPNDIRKSEGFMHCGLINMPSSKKFTVYVTTKLDTTYMTCAIYKILDGNPKVFIAYSRDNINRPFLVDTTKDIDGASSYRVYITNHDGTNYIDFNKEDFDILILEGDHTQNPPEYFEGLLSAGQDVEEVSVESVNENPINFNSVKRVGSKGVFEVNYGESSVTISRLDDMNYEGAIFEAYLDKGNHIISFDRYPNGIGCVFEILDRNMKRVHRESYSDPRFTINNSGKYYIGVYKHSVNSSTVTISNIRIDNIATKHKQDKKPLLYYNPTTQTWEKPVLRQWDTIEKHSDGKYYYHKRSEEVVLNGSENWQTFGFEEKLQTVRFYSTNYSICRREVVCDKIPFNATINESATIDGFAISGYTQQIRISIEKSKLSTQDIAGFKAWLQANPTTVVYQLAQEEVYECTNIDLITYANETNYIVNSGAISPKSTLKVHNNISNVVKMLQEKVSLLESNVKASQEVQDMMILESDMRILDMELALMEYMPANLNLGGDIMFRSATYFNFLKNHIENETYEKEYLENVMNKYLATNRLTQEEYDELYKLLYPPVYDIELPIEY